jgi:hypothetical protein
MRDSAGHVTGDDRMRAFPRLWNGYGTQQWRPTANDGGVTPQIHPQTQSVTTNREQRQTATPNCHAGGRGFESRRSRFRPA